MITALLHTAMANPRVYDAVQRAVGANALRQRIREVLPRMPDGAVVVDIGGGTGAMREVVPPESRYVCLDCDPLKVAGFRAKFADAAVLADAAMLPFAAGALDAVSCALVSHHLEEPVLTGLIESAARVLKPDGVFVFVDAVWEPRRLAARVMWRYDRGSHPRPAERLRELIAARMRIVRWETFAVWHRYVICLASPARA